MSRWWNIKANFFPNQIELVQINEYGEERVKEVYTKYPMYLIAKKLSTDEVIDNIKRDPKVSDIKVESWSLPPWYDKKADIIRVELEYYLALNPLLKRWELEGYLERVNVQPSSKTISLIENGVVLFEWDSEVSDPWSPRLSFPELKIASITYDEKRVKLNFYALSCSRNRATNFIEMELHDERDLVGYLNECNIIILPKNLSEMIIDNAKNMRNKILIIDVRNPIDSIPGWMIIGRISFTNLNEVASSSIGKLLTEIEAIEAYRRKMVVPNIRIYNEGWRNVDELLTYDSGGLIGIPEAGVYENVLQIDFSSLYPSIISKFNISPETIDRPNCRNRLHLNDAPHEVCVDFDGLVSSTLKKLIDLRSKIKEINGPFSKTMEKAVKWIMVASFGYLGYRNARFGNVGAYELVIFISKKVMNKAIEISLKNGFNVLHYIVDSLFLQKFSKELINDMDANRLLGEIEKGTGLKIKEEQRYKWIIFPKALNPIKSAAPNRYYGLTYDGELIVKGVKCEGIEGLKVNDSVLEEKMKKLLLKNSHPRKLCGEILFLLSKFSDKKP
ncbi:DNA polymerase domain-containing protein [Fervidicoccus fontis]|uniref:DNA polymerase domain-containing protein n=1 Tax=Fervidicoccus fontis TaxID=683846 RepID=UPI002353621D|nr:DNA polymerase domain-containing protein [Fervidicoccus fontis]